MKPNLTRSLAGGLAGTLMMTMMTRFVAPMMLGHPMDIAGMLGNMMGGNRPGLPEEADLSKVDLPTRMMLMKLQPKLREELLQGMREEGPEGYQKFVQDYFKRLTDEKWQAKINAGRAPAAPVWTKSFLIPTMPRRISQN